MKHIALILPHAYKLSSVASILEVFETVNDLYSAKGKEHPFRIYMVQSGTQELETGKYFHGYNLKSLQFTRKPDLVLIPGIKGDLRQVRQCHAEHIKWLQKQSEAGAEIAGFCTGALLFAASGLLNGKLATTHVDACARFVLDFPSVFVKPGRTLTADGKCYTSGGANASFHLLIFLVQKFCGNETAVRISKIFAVELDRHQQSYFSTFRPDHSHHDEMIRRLQQKIESDYMRIQTIDELTRDLPASRRNIARRFKAMTGVPPIEYLQNIRVEAAKRLLEQTDHDISGIIRVTGYTDPKSFRKVFLKLVGVAPLQYRDKFRIR